MQNTPKLGGALALVWLGLFALIASGGGENLYAIVLFGFPWVFAVLGVLDAVGASHPGLLVFILPLAINAVIIYKATAWAQHGLVRPLVRPHNGFQY